MWLRLTYVIRYFQIPYSMCDKYYKTLFYLRLMMLIELLEIIAFVFLLALVIFIISVGCCRAFCPNVIEAHSVLVAVSGLMGDGASAAAIKFVTDNLPKAKFDPDVHTSEKECSICIEEYVKGEEIAELPCDKRHYFHASCVMNWIKEAKKVSCPICRKDMATELAKVQERDKDQYRLDNVVVNV
eukprot:TRINITY_DN170_c0_g2_i1.p1 TRINITY_DN170_c0_g2~~TRINITY_DN170_c0_g2_i1.p1  ORF type:complete len:185 (-),score=35.38 TRINITY_DN170_c0_g2_i1:154-708(-)